MVSPGSRSRLSAAPYTPRSCMVSRACSQRPWPDLGVAADRAQADVVQGLGGEPGIGELLLEEGAQGVAQLVGVDVLLLKDLFRLRCFRQTGIRHRLWLALHFFRDLLALGHEFIPH